MNTQVTWLAAVVLNLAAPIALARDIAADEMLRLKEAGVILPFEKLDALALGAHPGARITSTELEREYGKYMYQVELRDSQGIEWDLELDAVTGQIYKNHQDN